jgi:dihydrofolate reductase
MKVTLFASMSVNGLIARKSGEEDFLSDGNWDCFCDLAKEHGCFVVGRKAYAAVKKFYSEYGFDDIKGVKKVILSRNKELDLGKEYIIAASPQEAIKKLSRSGVKRVLVAGGSTVNSAFARAGLVDQVVLSCEPVVVGKGKPVFAPEDFDLPLKLEEAKKQKDGRLVLKYSVRK